MKKILIAVESETMSRQLQEQLSGLHCVLVCHNGLDAAEILREQNPDVLLLDLRLPGIDGITLLQAARDSGIRMPVIAMADYVSEHIARALGQLEVSSVLRMDSRASCVLVRILELLQQDQQNDQHFQLQRILALLGFKLNTAGYRITEQAIYCYRENPGQHITTQLYPKVADLCNGTVSQVEKAIRSSVEAAWKAGDKQLWRLYFGSDANGKPMKPSNGDFLARISLCLTEKQERERKNA